ncbi:hypothetical protein ABNB59_19660 [Paenibacillus larvae]|uniref:Uncharacterized protein n=3 Tax=root TaxID=1 RepID=A0A0C5AJ53_9CAUD|nr:hypothetical protein [Paenibacillus larvae]YP_009202215.1 minor tail protein [Bacteriophage Lily]AJK27733.1 hypothetical protein LILY_9 [Bacteriophage Lily]AQT84156.1 hypothetical protein B1222_06755 [Paenibacillus larvae subsp. pulvifaciens]AQZ46136.1 hypothetical protein B5S25_05400 [Paenibacillus larvae subsp. pulvifaciens]AVF27797.1 hypothetical protein ERICIII_03688 [Paenibacillus larvae subsp. larvae]AVF32300.1 hypothetical protein ERICIV_03431 [Paenibacillus larvae subsp. larvae]
MKFKEQMSKDIQTFMCRDEFAEPHILDGREVWMIIEAFTLDGQPLPYAEGVSLHQIIVHVAEDELGYIPAQGQRSDLDGISVSVEKVSVDAGMLKIILEANVA